MALRALANLGLPQSDLNRLLAHGLHTAQDVLGQTELELMQLLNMPRSNVLSLLRAVSLAICPPCKTVWQLRSERRPGESHLRLDLPPLDAALRGGIPAGSITELVCKMLSIFATLPLSQGGLAGTVIYIDTEHKWSSKRLMEIVRARCRQHFRSEAAVQELMTRIIVVSPSSTSDLLRRLEVMDHVVTERGVKLISIDSIAALPRSEYAADRLFERQEMLGRIAVVLKYIAEHFNIPVLVTNQVMAQRAEASKELQFAFEKRPGMLDDHQQGEEGAPDHSDAATVVTAALGAKWAHCVNTRLVMEFVKSQRYIKVAKSPVSPVVAFKYTVESGGIVLDNDSNSPRTGDASVLNMPIGNQGVVAFEMKVDTKH
eukprot:jgi/Chlat1/4623/Chrsp3S00433